MTDKKPTSIFLIGMMASGKSTVGRRLAERLGLRKKKVVQFRIFLKKKERRDFELGKRKCWLS